MSDPAIHPQARGFGRAAHVYERGRPAYPAAAVRWLAARLDLGPGRRVLDLAAGTGKLTRQLLPTGASVVAVEPVAEMRERLQALVPEVTAIEGTAERIPLPDESMDAVTVGQAFHWFRPDEALAEIHRVLRPHRGLGLVWNTRDERDPLQRAAAEVVEALRAGAPWWRTFDVAALLAASPLFHAVDEKRFEHRQELDADAFVDRFLSISFVAGSPPEARRQAEAQLRALVAERPGPVVLPYVTEAYVTFRR